jgi:hypothetical protein
MAKRKNEHGLVDRILHPEHRQSAEPVGELQDPPADADEQADADAEPAAPVKPAEQASPPKSEKRPAHAVKAARDYLQHPKFSKFQKGK